MGQSFDVFLLLKNRSLTPMGTSTATKTKRQKAMTKVQAMAAALEEEYFPPVCSTRQQTISSTTIISSSTLQKANLLNFLYRPLQQSIKNSTTTMTAANRKKRNLYPKGKTTMMGRTTFFAKLMYITFFSLKYSTLQQQAQDIVKMRICRQIIERIITTLFSLKTSDTNKTSVVYWAIMYSTLSRNLATCISTFSLKRYMQVGPQGFSGSGWKCSKMTSPLGSCYSSFCSCFLRCTATRQMTISSTIAIIVNIPISKMFCPISVCLRKVFSLKYLPAINVQSADLQPAPMMFQIMRCCMAQSRYPTGFTQAISTRLYSPNVWIVRKRQKLSLVPITTQETLRMMKRRIPNALVLPAVVSTQVPVWYTLDQQAAGVVLGSQTTEIALPLGQERQLMYWGPVQLKQEQ